MKNNLRQVTRSVTAVAKKLDSGAAKARDEMMLTLVQLSKEEIKGRRPKGQRAVNGEPPMNRTGNLRRSIKGERGVSGLRGYTAIVGPTIVYGRAVEVGGPYRPPTWSDNLKFPYMAPAYAKFRSIAPVIVRKHMAVWK